MKKSKIYYYLFNDIIFVLNKTINLTKSKFYFTGMFKVLLPQYDLMPGRLVPESLNLDSGFDDVGKEIKNKYFGKHMVATSIYEFKKVSIFSTATYIRPLQYNLNTSIN